MDASHAPVDRHLLFRYLEPGEVERVLSRCAVREVARGEFVLRSGQPGDRMYLLEEGRVEVLDDRVEQALVLAQIDAGSFFGEIALLDGERRTKDVRAVSACRVRELRRDDFLRLYAEEPALFAKLSRALSEVLSTRLRGTLRDDHPLVRYIRGLKRSQRRPAAVAAPAAAPEAGERAALDRLYHAILRTKRELFALGDSLAGLASGEALARGGAAADRLLASLLEHLDAALDDGGGRERLGQVKRLFLQEMYPVLMRSPTIDEAYLKPRGYSLDAPLLARVYRGEPEGADPVGLLVDRFALERPLLRALRRRIDHAASFLARQATARLDAGAPEVRILAIGCGPGIEAIAAFRQAGAGARVALTCLDPDPEALSGIGDRAAAVGLRRGLRLLQVDPLGMLERPDPLRGTDADVAYGLTILDRLEDPKAAALLTAAHGALREGGEIYFAATDPADPSRRFAEVVLEWFLRRRRAGDLRALLAESPFGDEGCRVEEDADGLNLVARARR